ncbi:MAG: helix-turn-helix transcriptional regulator [Nanoarchaeota archaeon]|nr:helix-turn-helix transcriptional regulator [Nanoarchaeota archaeon]
MKSTIDRCTIYETANFIGKKWTLIILLELYKGKEWSKRYSEIKDNIPMITAKILSARLRELEKEGLITKKIDASSFPIKCHYRLTKSGEEFIRIIRDIKSWALRWKIKNKACQRLDCRNCVI